MAETEEKKIEFPSTEIFVKMIEGIRRVKVRDGDALTYDFTFSADERANVQITWDGGDDTLYSETDLEEITERYIKMISAIPEILKAGYTITSINFIKAMGFAGVVFKYQLPSGRIMENRYFSTADASSMIPDDFLHDLLYLPSRV